MVLIYEQEVLTDVKKKARIRWVGGQSVEGM